MVVVRVQVHYYTTFFARGSVYGLGRAHRSAFCLEALQIALSSDEIRGKPSFVSLLLAVAPDLGDSESNEGSASRDDFNWLDFRVTWLYNLPREPRE
jgi:hypothetical protein